MNREKKAFFFLRSKIRFVGSLRLSTILFPNALGDGERVRDRE
jgi:hypothetical protein